MARVRASELHAPAAARTASLSFPSPVTLSAIEARLVRLPLVEPFETSFGRVETRQIFLVSVESEGIRGWGEVVAFVEPDYSYETVETARHVIRDFFAPALLGTDGRPETKGPLVSLADVPARLARFRGHPMARAGLELALADLLSRLHGRSLSATLGGARSRIPVGVSLGIQPTRDALLDRVARHVELGYRRIKLKIKPAWDVEVLSEVRRRFPTIVLSVDANAAYKPEDLDHLKRFDDFSLLMIEQPLAYDDLLDHAALQRELETAICLDESITGPRAARQALAAGSCRIVNMKVGRVGGYTQAVPIHDLCVATRTPLWCGGMLESGIGRAHNIALASLPGFTLAGDISASRRYFERDLIAPEVTVSEDGFVEVPSGAGLGFEVDVDFVRAGTVALDRHVAA